MSGPPWTGARDYGSDMSELDAHSFLIRQIIATVAGSAVVQVKAVTNAGGISPVGFVDVLPLVNQIDGNGNATPHGIIHHLPYVRIQGGTNAVILDPIVGDIGIAVFADRDISSVKATKAQANPGSRRQNDMADGVYFGGILNAVPKQYVAFAAGGITVVSPTKITIQAPSVEADASTQFTINSPLITLNGLLHQGTDTLGGAATIQGPVTVVTTVAAADVTGSGTSLHTHAHSGVTAGGGTSGPPV